MVQGQDQAIHFIDHLADLDVGSQMAGVHGLLDAALQRIAPGLDHGHQVIADGTGTVVVFDRAADVDATQRDFHRDLLDPAREHPFQARQAAWFLDGGIEHILLEAVVIQPHDLDLQVLAGAEVGEDAGLAHLHLFGQQADGQPFQAVTAGQFQRHIQDGGTGLLTLAQILGPGGRSGHLACLSHRYLFDIRRQAATGRNRFGRGGSAAAVLYPVCAT